MPVINEIYGILLDDHDPKVEHECICPFLGYSCDGGGNRHQTKISLDRHPDFRKYFPDHIKEVLPAVCSIRHGNEVWVVCPRRIFSIPSAGLPLPIHVSEVLLAAGVPKGIDVGVWSEVYLRERRRVEASDDDFSTSTDDDADINYHFDFLVTPVRLNVTLDEVFHQFEAASESDRKELLSILRKVHALPKKVTGQSIIPYIPVVDTPIIIEVMTASTSGSDTKAGTNISSAFKAAYAGESHESPGINKRQVWGRMATQLFSKSALAEFWGGKTIWVIQDELLKNIELTTKLRLDKDVTPNSEAVNFAVMSYQADSSLSLDHTYSVTAGLSYSGNNSCVDILLPKVLPDKKALLLSLIRRGVKSVVRL